MIAPRVHRPHVTIIARDLCRALAHAVAMRGTFDAAVVHAAHPLAQAEALAGVSDALVVDLDPAVQVVAVRALLDRAGAAPIVFVTSQLPLRHALARAICESGNVVITSTEPAIVVQAMLVARLRCSRAVA